MVNLDFRQGFYELRVSLSRSPFNRVLLEKMFGVVIDNKTEVHSLIKSKNIDDLIPKMKSYLEVVKLLNI